MERNKKGGLNVLLQVGRWWWICCVLLALAGCSRTRYFMRADRETYAILAEKTAGTPWSPPADYSITPDPRSRLVDPTSPVDPLLPPPSPRLYAYQLPELPQRDPNRFRALEATRREHDSAFAILRKLPPVHAPRFVGTSASQFALHNPWTQPRLFEPPGGPIRELRKLPALHSPLHARGLVQQVAYQEESQPPADDELPPPGAEESPLGLRIVPIPEEVWQSLPPECRLRMFEFRSIRDEYERTFRRPPPDSMRDPSQRLTLEDIVELAQINSREYQTAKEVLYRVALRLTLERFDYDLKFSNTGNGTAANYTHDRAGGTTVNHLAIPTTVNSDKLLATGGDLLARFANDVVLTFNGPDGFAADVGSELLFDISQSVFQRDVVFEQLTQAERDVVYAARDLTRFRRELFRTLAAQYYNLLLTYRGIEIDAQDYFSNQRGFDQGQAEYRAGRLPRIQVDQFEQNALASRSSLIGDCNALETGLDNLKLLIGLPPELPINLDLTELEHLTLRDEITVAAELVGRARRELRSLRQVPAPDRGELLNAAINLTRRILELVRLRERLGVPSDRGRPLELRLSRLLVEEARLLIAFNREVLTRDKAAMPAAPPLRIFQRSMDLIDSMLILIQRQADLAAMTSEQPQVAQPVRRLHGELREQYEIIRDELDEAVNNRQLERIPVLVASAEALLRDVEALARAADDLIQAEVLTPEQQLQRTLEEVDRLLAQSEELLRDESGGLAPVELPMDEAMLTALVRRFDLLNQRGDLADFWRRIKLAGDDLRSILNLNATQLIRTRSDVNRVFDFTFDESQTRLSMSLDTPLNRKAQRNAFRNALINYQAALRSLVQLEDNIKADVRDNIRQLRLRREQYQIAVASAALASERVVSTRLQLQLGVADVAARDVLESQQAYTASLSAVARQHIGYILDRIQFFLDLELLDVDESGFWPELYNDRYQPVADYVLPPYGLPAYGELPRRVWHSRDIRRMLHVPAGNPEIHQAQPNEALPPGEAIPTPAPVPQQ